MRASVDTSTPRPDVLSGDLKEEQSILRAIWRRRSSPCWRMEGGVFDATETVVGVGGRPAVLHCSGVSPFLAGLVRTRPSLARLIRRSTADDVVLGVDTVRPQSSVQPTVLRFSRLSPWRQPDVE